MSMPAPFDTEFDKLKTNFLGVAQDVTAAESDRHTALNLLEKLESELAKIEHGTYKETIASGMTPDKRTNCVDLNITMYDEYRKLRPLREVKTVQHVHVLQRPDKKVADPADENFFGGETS